jgi:hypothetical protein
LTFAEAVARIWVGDCGRSLVPTDDRQEIAAERKVANRR